MRSVWFPLVLMAVVLMIGCQDREKLEQLTRENLELKEENATLRSDMRKLQKDFSRLRFLARQLKGVKARIKTNYGDIELELFPDKAPLHCFAFVTRAESGFYDNTQFHRVIPGFMIQGGDPNSRDKDPYNDGMGGPLVNIPHEFNDTKHVPGVLSTARVSDPGVGAGCQFFIMHGEAPHLDGQYTAFGRVTKGMEVVDRIANVQTYRKLGRPLQGREKALADHPVKPVIIKTIEVYRETD